MQKSKKKGARANSANAGFENKIVFPDYKAKDFLKDYASIPKNFILDIKDARKIIMDKKIDASYLKKLESFDYQVAVKIVSDSIIHKTDVGAVKLVQDKDMFFSTLAGMMKTAEKFDAKGFMIEELVEGEELIIGIKKDKTFNHVICFGVGGIFVEILKDVAFRACPITLEDAESMINELKARQILLGARGKKYNLDILKKTLVAISKIPLTKEGLSIEELDINPFMLNDKEGFIVDARIVFGR